VTTNSKPETEPHVAELLAALGETQAAITAKFPLARFFAFWDLDGTLLHGDCSEGLSEGGREIYPGLVQLAIEEGLAIPCGYHPAGGFAKCWHTYRWLEEHRGRAEAYPFLAQVFAGAEESVLTRLATDYFDRKLKHYYYIASQLIFAGLAARGVEQHVISASADVFVRGAAQSLGLAPGHLHGIRVRAAGGRLTRELLLPITFAAGKTTRLIEIVATTQAATPDRPVFILAGFGNSVLTDGNFLGHISAQTLPAGQPLALMINAGTEPASPPMQCRHVRHARIAGPGERPAKI